MLPILPECWRFPAEVAGWLSLAEGRALASLALLASGPILEVGSYEGRSTLCFAQVAPVVSVDPHTGDPGTGQRAFPGTLPALVANLERHGLSQRVSLHVCSFAQAAPILLASGQRFGIVFLDAAHDERSVYHDVTAALSLLRPPGILALHDWGYSTVRHGAARALGIHPEPGLTPAGKVDELAWLFCPVSSP